MPAPEQPTPGPTAPPAESWIPTCCARCGGRDGEVLLTIPHPDAPQGLSFIRQCAGCGLRRLDPRPGPDVIGQYYAEASGYNAFAGRRRSPRAQRLWDRLRDGYARPAGLGWPARSLGWFTGPVARWAFDINVRLNGRLGLRVLEVGSGFGDILIYLQSRGCRVTGTDLSASAVSKAREYGIDVRLGHLADMGFPDASFDVAIMSHSLEHVPDPDTELRELARVLAPGGQLHIAVPNGQAVRLGTDGVEWMHLSHPFHFWFFDPASLVAMVRRHGFEPVSRPRTTTRHHAWGLWRNEVGRAGFLPATRRLLRYLGASLGHPDGGDVLRLVCRRV